MEDNKYGISTPTARFLPFNLGIFNEDLTVKVNARYPDEVCEAGRAAVEKARRGDGPTVLWWDLDRLSSHTSSDDHRVYRPLEDIEEMSGRDPIRLLAEGCARPASLMTTASQACRRRLRAKWTRTTSARSGRPIRSPRRRLLHNFGEERPAEAPPLQAGRMTMVSAINGTLRKALEEDPNVVMFGEDIEDPKGGVFGLTKGLSEGFPRQVFNSPLAEATILGVAVGMAQAGVKPVFELQFIDFVAPG